MEHGHKILNSTAVLTIPTSFSAEDKRFSINYTVKFYVQMTYSIFGNGQIFAVKTGMCINNMISVLHHFAVSMQIIKNEM